MGRRGPAPAPTALKLLQGTRDDRINKDEPVPDTVDPVLLAAPEWLHPESLPIWNAYAPDLIRKGVLTAWDIEAFGACVDAAARRRRAVAALKTEGEVIKLPVFNKNGELTGERLGRNPWLVVLTQADGQLQRWAARFGMTPSDRAQLAGGDGRRDPHEDLLSA